MNTNSPNNDIDPKRVARLLTYAAGRLDDKTVASLRRGRDVALERQSVGNSAQGIHWLIPHSVHQWAATAVLFIAVVFGGVSYWQYSHDTELAHLDAAILTDDMPLEAFVDNFNNHPGQ